MSPFGWRRLWQCAAGILGAAGVASAAASAHGLAESATHNVDLASRFLLIDALALLAVGALTRGHERWLRLTGALFALGAVCFCGGLVLAALVAHGFAPIIPIGGTALILGWTVLAVSALADPPPLT